MEKKPTQKSKFTQKDKQVRGAKGESLITDSLRPQKIWNHKFVNAGFGTVFDKLILPPGHGYGVEVKVRQIPRIAHNLGSISKNEINGLDKFMNQVGKDHAYIIGIWLTEDVKRAFLIPWHKVREPVMAGVRGSINMLDFPELPRKGTGWDLSMMWEVVSNDKGN